MCAVRVVRDLLILIASRYTSTTTRTRNRMSAISVVKGTEPTLYCNYTKEDTQVSVKCVK